MAKKRKKKKAQGGMATHFIGLGFTNRLALYLIGFLAFGLLGGFVLAVLSIKYDHTGALACWTIVFTPIGTAIGIVLAMVVDKSKAENTGATDKKGEGVAYLKAKAALVPESWSNNSPPV